MYKKIFTGFAVALAMAPGLASAQSTNTMTQIQALMAQIQALQGQLKTLVASSSVSGQWNWQMGSTTNMNLGQAGKMACITLSRNLRQGDQGDDVRKLQEMLREDRENEFDGSATGFFGPMTAKAMMKFQTRMGVASSTDGSVGPMTRGFFERKCGNGLGGGQGGGQGMNSGPGNIKDMMGKLQSGEMINGIALRGTLSANNGSSITIQGEGGQSVVVNITSSTMIKLFNGTSTPPTTGAGTDLVVGKKVTVEGTKNSDGSVQARVIAVGEILPMIKAIGDDIKDKIKDFLPNMMFKFEGGGQKGPGGPGGQRGSIVPGGQNASGENSGSGNN